jgi:paraquat-inducible protein A
LKSGLAVCHTCLALSAVDANKCARCGSSIHPRIPDSIQHTIAYLIAASILYIPANIFPIMTTEQFGTPMDSTIIGGVILLWNMGSYPIALIIFIASVLVPIGKIFTIAMLSWTVTREHKTSLRQRTKLYRITELIGKWSMVDIFVVAILVALIQITGIIVITPGSAALAFAGMVILTMLSAISFDPRLIWDRVST